MIVALLYGCVVFARPDNKVPATDTSCPTVTLTQEQFDSLIAAAAKSHRMELIAKEESEKMFSSYTTHVGWVVGIVVGLFGVALPYVINRRNLNEIRNIKKEAKAIKEAAEKDAHDAKAYGLFAWARQKSEDKAIELYTRAIAEKKDFWEAYYNRGIRYRKKGDYDQAIKDYDRAIELNPQLAAAYYNRGNAYYDKGNYAQAIKDYNKAIELNPQNAEAYYNRGNAYRKKGDYDQAIKDYDKAIELNPRDASAYNQLCYAYLGKKDFPATLEAVNKAITLKPSDPNYYDSRADVWMAWGKYKKEHLEEFPDIDWKDDIRKAQSDVAKAFSLNPYEELKKMLEDKRAECEQLLAE